MSGSDSDSNSRISESECSDSESVSDYSIGKPDSDLDDFGETGSDSEPSLVLCLFCSDSFDLAELFDHVKEAHNFDVFALREKFLMDQFSYIKLINFIRRESKNLENTVESKDGNNKKISDSLIEKISNSSFPLWEADENLQPVLEQDPLLSYWFECETTEDDAAAINTGNEPSDGLTTDHALDLLASGDDDSDLILLQAENLELKRKTHEYENLLSETFQQMEDMKKCMGRVIGDEASTKKQIMSRYSRVFSKHNAEYFESYDSLQIHDTMISDTQRTEAYQAAILNNAVDFKDKIALDVGCGTSILSMFAAKAGASKVFAVDQSKILEKAVEIVKENNFQDTIECIRGTVESISLPVEQVDIIISEFMGYFLLFEGMLSSYLDARKKFLRPGGAMYPNTADIFLVGVDDFAKYEENSRKWDNVYGFKMTSLKGQQKPDVNVEPIKEELCVTDSVKVLSLDLLTCEYEDAAFNTNFVLSATKDCTLTAVLGYFDVGFTCGSNFKNTLSTGPHVPQTHWYQTLMTLDKPVTMKKGDKLSGVFDCRPNLRNPRSLDLTLTIAGDKYKYTLD